MVHGLAHDEASIDRNSRGKDLEALMWRASRRFRALCAAHLFLVRGDEALLLRRALTLTFHADHEVDRERDAGAGVWFESYGWRAWLSPPHHAWQRALHVRPGLRSAGVAQE